MRRHTLHMRNGVAQRKGRTVAGAASRTVAALNACRAEIIAAALPE
jgi:hypothetical protein